MARRLSIPLVALALVLAAPSAAQAAEQQAYAAGLNYATPAVGAAAGDTLRFTNLDSVAQHDLDSDTPGLFDSALIPAGKSELVPGVEKLPPGQYPFHCSLHSWMHGVVTVAAGGGGGGPSPPPPPGSPGGGGGSPPNPVDLMPKVPPKPLGKTEWPFYGRDLSNSRNGGPTGPSYNEVPTLGPVWSFASSDGDFTGTPVVSRGRLVVASGGGSVFALDAVNGKKLWAKDLNAPINGTAAIAGRRVFVPVATPSAPSVAAFDLRNGKPLWRTRVDRQKNSDVFGSPVVWRPKRGKPTVYIGTSAEYGEVNDPDVNVRGSVVALDAATGRKRWKTFTVPPKHDGGSVWNTPAIDPASGRLYVGTGNAYHKPAADTTDAVLALDARSGRVLAKRQATAGDVWNGTEGRANGPDYDFGASLNLMRRGDGRRLVGAGQKSGIYWAFEPKTLKPVWSAVTGPAGPAVGGIVGSTAADGRRIYGPDTLGGEIWALDLAGSMSWVSSDGGPLQFSPVSVANGVVYTTDMSTHLTARDAGTGAVLAKLPLGAPSWGGVSIAGGSVFAVTGTQGSGGYVVAYRPRG